MIEKFPMSRVNDALEQLVPKPNQRKSNKSVRRAFEPECLSRVAFQFWHRLCGQWWYEVDFIAHLDDRLHSCPIPD